MNSISMQDNIYATGYLKSISTDKLASKMKKPENPIASNQEAEALPETEKQFYATSYVKSNNYALEKMLAGGKDVQMQKNVDYYKQMAPMKMRK